jgi:hypothetical protein
MHGVNHLLPDFDHHLGETAEPPFTVPPVESFVPVGDQFAEDLMVDSRFPRIAS